jgi:hypothetical protein
VKKKNEKERIMREKKKKKKKKKKKDTSARKENIVTRSCPHRKQAMKESNASKIHKRGHPLGKGRGG